MRNLSLNQTLGCHTNAHFRLKETNKRTWTAALPPQLYNLKLKLPGLIELSTGTQDQAESKRIFRRPMD